MGGAVCAPGAVPFCFRIRPPFTILNSVILARNKKLANRGEQPTILTIKVKSLSLEDCLLVLLPYNMLAA